MATKEAKGTSASKTEPCAAPALYAEWAAACQAYYGNGTSTPYPCFFPAFAVASNPHQSQPYNWSGQPMMGPYGNGAFPCMYPPYGYAHPTVLSGSAPYNPYAAPAPSTELVMAAPPAETDEKSSVINGARHPKGGMVATHGSDEATKATSGSECGTGGFSDGSEEEFIPNEFETTSKARINKFGNGNCQNGTLPAHVNVGADSWGQSTPARSQGKHRSADLSATSLPVLSGSHPIYHGQNGAGMDAWSQDDKETKRQKRKQSNRESARRSRLRKQAECGELGTRVDALMAENTSLRTELDRLSAECKKLAAENAAIMECMQCREGETNDGSDKQDGSQSEDDASSVRGSSFDRRPMFHLPNEMRTATLHELGGAGGGRLPMGQTDSIAAS